MSNPEILPKDNTKLSYIGNVAIKQEIAETLKGENYYLDLYKRQEAFGCKMKEMIEEKKLPESFSILPNQLVFHGNTVVYLALWYACMFKQEDDGTFTKIPLLEDEINKKDEINKTEKKIHQIINLGHGLFRVDLVSVNEDGWRLDNKTDAYIVDEKGNVKDEIGKLDNKNKHFYSNTFLDFGEYYFFNEKNNEKNEDKMTMYNLSFEKLFQYDRNKLSLQYIDKKAKVGVFLEYGEFPPKYKIINIDGIIAEGTESELENNEFMKDYNQYKKETNKKREKKIEEDKKLFNCNVAYDKETKNVTIHNYGEPKLELYSIDNVESKDNNTLYLKGKTIEIYGTDSEGDLLMIQETYNNYNSKPEYNVRIVNKKTGKSINFNTNTSSIYKNNFVQVFENGTRYLYNSDLEKIGNINRDHYGIICVTEVDGNNCLYSEKTGAKICDLDEINFYKVIKREFPKAIIIETKNGLIQYDKN